MTAAERVAGVLIANRLRVYCDDCLAEQLAALS